MIQAINSFSEAWFRYMASAGLQASLLALALLGIVLIGRRWSPALRHALLMIALLKFAIPPSLSLPTGLFYHVKPIAESQTTFPADLVVPVVQEVFWPTEKLWEAPPPSSAGGTAARMRAPAAPLPEAILQKNPKQPVTVSGILVLLHLLGALVIIALVVVQKFRLRRLAFEATPATDPELLQTHEDLCTAMKLVRHPRLLLSSRNHAPMTFGTWKPAVVLPADLLAALPHSEIRVILGHELAHHRRWDLWLGWLQLPISAVWWFNPVYWLLARRIRSVREDCCDDLVVSSGLATGEAYCETLLQAARIASGKLMAGASLAYIGESQPLRRRFKRIMNNKLITAPRLAWTGIVIVILLALLFLPGIRKRQTDANLPAPAAGKGSTAPMTDSTAPMAMPFLQYFPGDARSSRSILFSVVDASNGRGIEGAALYSGLFSTRGENPAEAGVLTDKEGRCLIAMPDPPKIVRVRAAGYFPRVTRFLAGEEYPEGHTFRLDKGLSIGGIVQDENGGPIENVKIAVYSSNPTLSMGASRSDRDSIDPWATAVTDHAGRWNCNEVLPNPDKVDISLAHPEHILTRYSTEPTPLLGASTVIQPIHSVEIADLIKDKAVLVMKRGLLVTGIVTDESGRGVGGASVRQFEEDRPVAASSIITTREGRFEFAVDKPGKIVLAVQAQGFAPETRTVAIAPGLPGIKFRLKKGQIVSGRMLDENGSPIAGASIGTALMPVDVERFSWDGKTDAQGRFRWDSAPSKPLWYWASAEGYRPSEPAMLEPSKENEIRLSRAGEIRVSGRVVDSQTRLPIEKFKVTAQGFGVIPATMGVDKGEFSLILKELPRRFDSYRILVEATGYLPDSSQSLTGKDDGRHLEYALVRGDGPSGIVLAPNGEPVVGANVFVCGGSGSGRLPSAPSMRSIKSIRSSDPEGFNASAVTDDSGHFSLAPVAQAHSVYATHDKGFAAITTEQLVASSKIVLQPWGRIEGALMIGSKPGANQAVTISTLITEIRPLALSVMQPARTDNEGKFVFPTLPSGEYRIFHSTMPAGMGQFAIARVHAGETVSVKIGGTGRPVIGRVTAVDESGARVRVGQATLSLRLPGKETLRPTDPAAYRNWIESEAVRDQMRSERRYSVRVEADGSFRLEDIASGTYILNFLIMPSEPAMLQLPPVSFAREIIIPEMSGGRSDDPLDLGAINLQLPPKK